MSELIYNEKLDANNVFEISIDENKLMDLMNGHLSGLNQTNFYKQKEKEIHVKETSMPFFAKIPHWRGDISWVSAASKRTFDFFDQCYNDLDIERKTKIATGLDIPLIMYSGFFVIRSFGRHTFYHQDYFNTGIQAFTLMTPVQLGDDNGTGHLLYKNTKEEECVYRYQKGKAIFFGSDFLHSTQPFESKQKYIFLCFTYGSQNLQTWEKAKETVANQGVVYRHPDGEIRVKNPDYLRYF